MVGFVPRRFTAKFTMMARPRRAERTTGPVLSSSAEEKRDKEEAQR